MATEHSSAPAPTVGPRSPTRLSRRRLWTAIKRSLQEFRQDNLPDWAAALTYYAVLSIFPGLLVLVSILGLIGQSATKPLLDNIGTIAPGPVRTILDQAVTSLQQGRHSAGFVAVISFGVAVWSASGYIAAFMRASNSIYDVPEGRPIWKKLPIRVGVTLVIGLLLVISAVIVVVSGDLARQLGRALGLESATITAWNITKWPVLVVLVSLMLALLYRAA
ncbi:MAG TPA: YihY/virulence factor BrkB family protein, partial [Micromonosporaceae bacterium]